jgi:hypothetical protein
MRLTLWCPAARVALPRVRSLRLHVLGQGRRGVDLLIEVVEMVLNLSRRDGAQPQAESQGPDVEFHRGQAIQDTVSKSSSTISEDGLLHD